jgi:membrane-associated protease RseP (regulator of RpoE activity)
MLLVVGATALAPVAMAAPDQNEKMFADPIAGRGRLGVGVIEISPELRTQMGAPKDRGVLVDTVRPDSPAARAGVRVGDVVVEVDGEAARSASDMLEAMSDRKQGEEVTIAVLRAGQRVQLTATLTDDAGPRMPRGPALGTPFPDRFDWQTPRFRDDIQRELEEARRRIDELERRLDKLERT